MLPEGLLENNGEVGGKVALAYSQALESSRFTRQSLINDLFADSIERKFLNTHHYFYENAPRLRTTPVIYQQVRESALAYLRAEGIFYTDRTR